MDKIFDIMNLRKFDEAAIKEMKFKTIYLS